MSVYNPTIGGGVIEFLVSQTSQWGAGNYAGVGVEAPSASPGDLLAWPAPAPGTVSDLAVQGNAYNVTGGALQVTLYKAPASLTPVFAATLLSATVLSNTATGYDPNAGHSFHVNAGDLVLAKLSGSGVWFSGQVVTALWTPD